MNIKTFIANNSQEALRKVKEEMGPEAVILKTRTITDSGGTNGMARERIEVTAAIDYDSPVGRGKEPFSFSGLDFHEKWEALEARLREITHFLIALEASTADGNLSVPREHYIYYRQFGIIPENIHRIRPSRRLAASSSGPGRKKELQQCLLDLLGSIKIAKESPGSKGRRIYAFVGPTGVGKTTTIAKLAALYKIKKRMKVALVTVDTYRIGAVAQLDTYARIMGVPLEVADSAEDLRRSLKRHEHADVVLIDTAGRSPRNPEDVSRIREVLSVPEPIYHYLVLSATTELDNLLAAEESFGVVSFKSIIFTKLDEAIDASAMVNFLLKRNKPVSYFTTGQNVPEDIEPATRKRIAELILRRNRTIRVEHSHEVREYGSGQPT